jgi:hypothetical protein
MAKKSSKVRSSKGSLATKRRRSAKAPAKPKRTGDSRVSFGMHGIRKIVSKIRSAGLEEEFNKAVGEDHQFVQVPRKSLLRIKKFVASRPELAGLHEDMEGCNCPPKDPYCIWI